MKFAIVASLLGLAVAAPATGPVGSTLDGVTGANPSGLADGAKGATDGVTGAVDGAVNNLEGALPGGDAAKGVTDNLGNTLGGVTNALGGTLGSLTNALGGTLGSLTNNLGLGTLLGGQQ